MDGSLKLLSKDHKDTVSPSLRLLFVWYCLRYAECSSQLSQKNREGQKFFQLNHLHINTITIWKLTERKKLYEKRKCHQGKNSEGKGTNGASKCAFSDRQKRTC
nr:MAG TPA: hypothetical protein [Caudoviricetes sp.]